MSSRRRGWSDITVTDQFCGAGGSSIGAAKVGLRIRMAMNHWDLAVETHNTNFPDTDHDCCDISASDPRRYPSTDILITSPECTTHSPAGGNRRSTPQRDMFIPTGEDPAVARSRATMRDVPRFAEFHRYRRIIVENVVEVTRWPLFHHWLKEMEILGYRWKLVSLNSMFCWPTPQSRDRLYIVFWRKGDRAPDMAITPLAPCHRCEKAVDAVQSWKPAALKRAMGGQPIGKYRTQYVYTCPTCRGEVAPFYYAALNAIDFTIPAERIGDRARPLMPRTIERITYGLEKYGRRQLVIRTNMTSGVECRVRGLEEPHFGQTASWLDGLFSPTLFRVSHSGGNGSYVYPGDAPMPAQTTAQDMGFVFNVGGRHSETSLDRAMPTQETRDKFGLFAPFAVRIQGPVQALGMDGVLPSQLASCAHEALITPSPFLAAFRGPTNAHRKQWASGLHESIGTVTADGVHHALIGPGFAPFITMRRGANHAAPVDGVVPTVTAQGEAQHLLVQHSPFVQTVASVTVPSSGVDEPMRTVLGTDRHGLVQPSGELRVEDCYFRMLQPKEIGAAMAFAADYKVLGNKRDQVKQYGNAVTPPAMTTLIERQVMAMTGERAE